MVWTSSQDLTCRSFLPPLPSCPLSLFRLVSTFDPPSACTQSKMAPQQKGFSWSNIGVGAVMNMFEVSEEYSMSCWK